jgi:hypothetical protein
MKRNHSEFSFVLHACRLGDRIRKATNPFTGELIVAPIDEGLTPAERKAILRVFRKYNVEGPEPEFEGYAFYLLGNGSVRFRGFADIEDTELHPVTSLAVEIVVKQLADDVLTFVLDVARQGNLAFMSSTADHVGLVNESDDPRIQKRWPDARTIATIEDLRSWLEVDIGGRRVHVPERK